MQLRKDEVVFTKHARERLEQRNITEEMALKAIATPYRFYTQKDGGMKFILRINGRNVHVVCQPLPEERKWLVKTVWVRGEDDADNVVNYREPMRINLSWLDLLIALLIAIIIVMGIIFLRFYTGIL
jgi:hypothetical protein